MIENSAGAETVKATLGRGSHAEPDDSGTGANRKRLSKEQADTSLTASNLPDASNLCVGCGLCCNGVLYSNIKIERDEVPRLEAAGHQVEQLGERFQFHPPCH